MKFLMKMAENKSTKKVYIISRFTNLILGLNYRSKKLKNDHFKMLRKLKGNPRTGCSSWSVKNSLVLLDLIFDSMMMPQ